MPSPKGLEFSPSQLIAAISASFSLIGAAFAVNPDSKMKINTVEMINALLIGFPPGFKKSI
jgi:hypothetical protein